MNCPLCGRKALKHESDPIYITTYGKGDAVFINASKHSHTIYRCDCCALFFRLPRGGKKKRSYINANDENYIDLVDLTAVAERGGVVEE